jgi:small subunit ribosomal protein S1
VGAQISVYVVNPEDRDGNIIVSIYLAQVEQDWQKAEEYLASKEIVEEKVIGYNKGGLVVPFGRIRAFVPASQVVGFPRRLSPNQKVERLAQQVGRQIVGQVIEVDRKRKRLIMSEQAAQSEWRARKQHELMDSLTEGQVARGVVTSLANFGAFVDLGGAEGLVHISELAWHRVKHPREVLKIGETVEVYVLKLDRANHKIGLSLRRLKPDPWSLVDTKYFIDQRVAGKITNVTDFGAFAHLEDGIEGLIHISELTEDAINHPSEVVKRGDRYLLEIIKIEPERQRIGLSLKRVPPEEQAAWRASQAASRAKSTGRPAPAEPKPSPAEVLETDASAGAEAGQVAAPPTEPGAALATEAEGSPQSTEGETASPDLLADAASATGEPQPETLLEEPVA